MHRAARCVRSPDASASTIAAVVERSGTELREMEVLLEARHSAPRRSSQSAATFAGARCASMRRYKVERAIAASRRGVGVGIAHLIQRRAQRVEGGAADRRAAVAAIAFDQAARGEQLERPEPSSARRGGGRRCAHENAVADAHLDLAAISSEMILAHESATRQLAGKLAFGRRAPS
jgi:hypothetical protein